MSELFKRYVIVRFYQNKPLMGLDGLMGTGRLSND